MAAFGLPNFGQLSEAFRKAKQIQEDAQKLQEELDEMRIEGLSKDERAAIILSGNQKPLEVKLENSLVIEGKEATEKAVFEALENAFYLSTETMKSRMEELTGSLNINLPGLGPSD